MSNPRIQLRHDTASNWSTANPVLLDGEVGIEKGIASIIGFDDSSTGSYTLNGTILTNPTPELEHDMGFTSLGDNKQLYLELRVKISATYTQSSQDLVRLGDYSGSNDVFFTRFEYRNGTCYVQLGVSSNGNFEIREASIPNDKLNTWVDLKFGLNYQDGSNMIYSYIGIKLPDDENYTTLNDNNINNVYFVGTTNKLTCFFYALEAEVNMKYCTASYDNTNVWTGMVEGSPTKLKIGDGETAWNDLPYII